MNTEPSSEHHQRNAVAPEWLSPSAALGRFTPPKDLLQTGVQEVAEFSRYGFKVSTFSLLIKAHIASEVIRLPAVSTLPGSAPWMMGLMNLRGNLVPLFDLPLALGMTRSDQGQGRLALILDKGENAVGMVIDGFPQPLLALRPIVNLPQLPALLQEHVHAGYVKDDQVWLDFNHESFFEKLALTAA